MIKINEIFYSIQGESSFAGYPCVFIRLSGCNLRCSYCDTQYAYHHGQTMTLEEIITEVSCYSCPLIEITGGEPLIQKETPVLAERLASMGFKILLETNGTLSIEPIRPFVHCIMDIKCPDSGESDKTYWKNINYLKPRDEVKFVLCSMKDYEWAKEIIGKHRLLEKALVLFSPVHGALSGEQLASRILEDQLQVRLQLQLHKMLWPNEDQGR